MLSAPHIAYSITQLAQVTPHDSQLAPLSHIATAPYIAHATSHAQLTPLTHSSHHSHTVLTTCKFNTSAGAASDQQLKLALLMLLFANIGSISFVAGRISAANNPNS